MFIPRGDREIGLAYQTHSGNQASFEGKQRTPLSFCLPCPSLQGNPENCGLSHPLAGATQANPRVLSFIHILFREDACQLSLGVSST